MKDKTEVVIVPGSLGMIDSALIHKLAEKHRVVGFDQDDYPMCRLLLSFKLGSTLKLVETTLLIRPKNK